MVMVVGEDVGAVELMREGGLTEEKKDSDSEEGEFLQKNQLQCLLFFFYFVIVLFHRSHSSLGS